MTYTITTGPHPLDKVWSDAIEAMHNAQCDMEAAKTDGEMNAVAARITEAFLTLMALPARNLSDCLYKFDVAGVDHGCFRNDCDPHALLEEAHDVLNAAIVRGSALQAEKQSEQGELQ